MEIATRFNFDLPYQKKILAMMVRDPKFLFSYGLDLVKPSYFSHYFFQMISKNLIIFVNRYNYLPDRDSFIRYLSEVLSKIEFQEKEAIQSMVSVADEIFLMEVDRIEDVIESVLRFTQEQSLKLGLSRVIKILEHGGNLEEAITIIQDSVSVGRPIAHGVHFNSEVESLKERYQKEYSKENCIETGYSKLDSAMLGGMFRKFLYTFVAPPGRGKTTILSNISSNAIRNGKNVVFYTLEVPEVEIEFKHISKLARLSHRDLLSLSLGEINDRIGKLSVNGNLFIKYFEPHSITVSSIRSHLYRLKYNHNFQPDLVIIDYADNMNSISSNSQKEFNSYDEKGNIYSDLISLAVSQNCPVLTASQPKVEAWTKNTITKGDLAESSKKAHLAHGILSLNQTPEEKEANRMRVYTAKMRKGLENTTINVITELEYSSIVEEPETTGALYLQPLQG